MKNLLYNVIVFLSLIIISVNSSHAQDAIDPVHWSFTLEDNGSDTVTVIATASIDSPWHIYSLVVSNDPEAMGPMPLEFTIENSDQYIAIANPEEFSKVITHHDVNFDMELNYFEEELVVKQKVKVYSRDNSITGNITFMACDDEQCIYPPALPFEIKLSNNK